LVYFWKTKPLSQTKIDRVKQKAIADSQVKEIRIHDLRHSHALNLIGSGMNIMAVSGRLGHCNTNTTMRTYVHLLQIADLELVNFVDKSSQYTIKPFK